MQLEWQSPSVGQPLGAILYFVHLHWFSSEEMGGAMAHADDKRPSIPGQTGRQDLKIVEENQIKLSRLLCSVHQFSLVSLEC